MILTIKMNFEIQQAILSVSVRKGRPFLQMHLQGLGPSRHLGHHSDSFRSTVKDRVGHKWKKWQMDGVTRPYCCSLAGPSFTV